MDARGRISVFDPKSCKQAVFIVLPVITIFLINTSCMGNQIKVTLDSVEQNLLCQKGDVRSVLFRIIEKDIKNYGIGASKILLDRHYKQIAKKLLVNQNFLSGCRIEETIHYLSRDDLGVMSNRIRYIVDSYLDRSTKYSRICVERQIISGPRLIGNKLNSRSTCIVGEKQ